MLDPGIKLEETTELFLILYPRFTVFVAFPIDIPLNIGGGGREKSTLQFDQFCMAGGGGGGGATGGFSVGRGGRI